MRESGLMDVADDQNLALELFIKNECMHTPHAQIKFYLVTVVFFPLFEVKGGSGRKEHSFIS